MTFAQPSSESLYTLPTEPIEVFTETAPLGKSIHNKVEIMTRGGGTRAVSEWFDAISKEAPQMLEKPTFKDARILMANLEEVWVPRLVAASVFERQIPPEKAVREAAETAFLCRDRLLSILVEKNTLKPDELNYLLVEHYIQSAADVNSKDLHKAESMSLRTYFTYTNEFYGAAVSYGVSHPAEFENIVNDLSNNAEKRQLKILAFAKDNREFYSYAANKLQTAVNAHSKERNDTLMGIEKGIRAEIQASWIMYALLEDLHADTLDVGKSGTELDLGGVGDAVIYSTNEDGTRTIKAIVEVKTEVREDIGVQYTYVGEDGQLVTEGILQFKRQIPENVSLYIEKTGIPVVSLRIQRRKVDRSLEKDLITAVKDARVATEAINKYTPTLVADLKKGEEQHE